MARDRMRYRITIRGRFSERFASAFEGTTMAHADGQTQLVTGPFEQSQLHGLLDRLGNLGVELIRVEEVTR